LGFGLSVKQNTLNFGLFAGVCLALAGADTSLAVDTNKFSWVDSLGKGFTVATFAPATTNAIVLTNRVPWESSLGIGFTLTRGNSDTLLATASMQTRRKTPEDEISLGMDGAYGENNSVQNVNSAHGFAQYNHLFNHRLFGYLRADALRDGIADLQYRITLSPGAGFFLIRRTNMSLAGEFGPAMVFERLGNQDNNYVTARLAERFEYKFTDYDARFWQSVVFLPQVDKFNNYVFSAEVGLEAAVTKKISLQGYLVDNFVNIPAADRQQNDLRIISGLRYKF
jgi:putative salt-induced outer membrane protein YdiY